MRVLVLGGTRFIGLAFCELLAQSSVEVVTCSRRSGSSTPGIRSIIGERDEILGAWPIFRDFDTVVDFTAYQGDDVASALSAFTDSRYILISTTWLARDIRGLAAAQRVPRNLEWRGQSSPTTEQYLLGKASAERYFYDTVETGRVGHIVRLPIVAGPRDHTGRMRFYAQRIADGGPLLAVDGGKNSIQIASVQDISQLLVQLTVKPPLGCGLIQECLVPPTHTVETLCEDIAQAMGEAFDFVSVPVATVQQHFAEYLEREPLWRENALPISSSNLFMTCDRSPTGLNTVVAELVDSFRPDTSWDYHQLRRQERDFAVAFGASVCAKGKTG